MTGHFFSLSPRPCSSLGVLQVSLLLGDYLPGPAVMLFAFFYELKHCLALAQGHIGNLVRALRHGIAGLSARGSRVVNPKLESFK